MTWQPILEGALAARAWDAVHAIADDIAAAPISAADVALFWSYAAPALDDREAARHHDDAMNRLAKEIDAATFTTIALYDGVCGVAWTAAHTAEGVDDFLDFVDQRVIEILQSARWSGSYDLISGLVGLGVYFLERGDRPSVATGLALIVDHLGALAEQTTDGTTWLTRPIHVPSHQRDKWPNGYYNCGLAHGVPGVIALLARIAARRDATAQTVKLLADATRWLTAQRDPARPGYPAMVGSGRSVGPARTAWCYGDPGIITALWTAAQVSDAPTAPLQDQALECLDRSPTDAKVSDAMLCHGSSGLAHIANRFYQRTQEPAFRDRAVRWFEHALGYRAPGTGVGGFSAIQRSGVATSSADFLDGSAGIGLALISALVPAEPAWDRLLLCDLA